MSKKPKPPLLFGPDPIETTLDEAGIKAEWKDTVLVDDHGLHPHGYSVTRGTATFPQALWPALGKELKGQFSNFYPPPSLQTDIALANYIYEIGRAALADSMGEHLGGWTASVGRCLAKPSGLERQRGRLYLSIVNEAGNFLLKRKGQGRVPQLFQIEVRVH